MVLIPDYVLEIYTPECDATAGSLAARAHLVGPGIAEALPYLNAQLGGIYDHENQVLISRWEGHKLAFRPREISAAAVADREQARQYLAKVVALVNDIWERREEFIPSYERREPPKVMEVYKLLPQTNCQQCGSSCFHFALKLVAQVTAPEGPGGTAVASLLEACPEMAAAGNDSGRREALVNLLNWDKAG